MRARAVFGIPIEYNKTCHFAFIDKHINNCNWQGRRYKSGATASSDRHRRRRWQRPLGTVFMYSIPDLDATGQASGTGRARYSAFAGNLLDYLRDTWHPSTRPAAVEPLPAGLRWLGLDVRRHAQQDADHAT